MLKPLVWIRRDQVVPIQHRLIVSGLVVPVGEISGSHVGVFDLSGQVNLVGSTDTFDFVIIQGSCQTWVDPLESI